MKEVDGLQTGGHCFMLLHTVLYIRVYLYV